MKPGLFHSCSNTARRSASVSSADALVHRVGETAERRVHRLAEVFEAGPQLALLLGRDRPVVEGRAPVGGALVDGDRLDVVENGRDDLHAARRRADDRDSLAGEVDRLRRPQPGVVLHAAEVVAPGHVRGVRHREDTGRGDEEPGPMLGPVAGDHRPGARRLVVHGRRDRRVEPHVAAEVEAVDHMVEVALDLRLAGEVLLPLPVVEQLLREEVAVRVALGVESGARVAVPEPRAPDAGTGLEQPRREPRLAGPVQLVDPGDARADDEDVDVDRDCGCGGFHGRCGPRGFLYRPVSLTTRQGTPSGRGAPHGGHGSEVVGTPGALRDGAPGPRPARSATSTPTSTRMEVEQLWPRVWQMACRLEEIPQPRDFVEYEFLDQSVVVVRTDDMGVTAFQNTCRHRGVRLVEGSGTCARGFRCPFHGWCYGPDGANTAGHAAADVRRAQPGGGRSRSRAGPVRDVGRVRVDQLRRQCAAGARVSGAGGVERSTRGRSSRCGPRSGTRAVSR